MSEQQPKQNDSQETGLKIFVKIAILATVCLLVAWGLSEAARYFMS